MTKYIVLHRPVYERTGPNSPPELGWLPLDGSFEAVRGEDACVQAAQKHDLGGEFRAVPARSWNEPVIIELDTTPRAVVKKPQAVSA